MQKKLKIAAYAGIVYLVSFLPEITLEALHDYYFMGGATKILLIGSYIIAILSTVVFFYGFIIIGNKYDDHLLVAGSYIIILTTIAYYFYSWQTMDLYAMEDDIFSTVVLLFYGFSGILFGIGLYRMRDPLGSLASIAGIIEIIIGICFVTIIPFLLGLVLSIPAIIIEILLLFNAVELGPFKEEENTIPG